VLHHAGDDEPREPRAELTDVDRQLRRVRPRDEVDRRHRVEEVPAVHPPPALDDLVLHQGDVRRGSAEGGEPEPREQHRDLLQPCTP
jgi:hypothetical protein